MEVLVAGNKDYGVAKSIYKLFPDAEFVSRSNGDWDLSKYQAQRDLAKKSLDFDVFISVSTIWKFHQTTLVQEVSKAWEESNHKGYMIVFGSSADTPVKASTWMYPTEKKALRAYCRQISQKSSGDQPWPIKMTYIAPGHIHTPKQDEKHPIRKKLDCDYIASVVKWLLSQPDDVNISEICFDRKV